MRLYPLALLALLPLGACRTAGPTAPLAVPTWAPVAETSSPAETLEEGITMRVAIDLARTVRVDSRTVRTVIEHAFTPARTVPFPGFVFDRDEEEHEVQCAEGTTVIWTVRRYLRGSEINESGRINGGEPMQAAGAQQLALERACRYAGVRVGG
jgi:hypothetical protein